MATPYRQAVEGFERYSFSDYDYWRTAISETPIRATGTSVTAEDGVARFAIPAALQANEGSQQFTISGDGYRFGRAGLSLSTQVTVSPASVSAGIRLREYLARAGEPSAIDLVAR